MLRERRSRPSARSRRLALIQLLLTTAIIGANFVGAAAVVVLLTVVLPLGEEASAGTLNIVAVPVYVTIAFVIGAFWGTRVLRPRATWFAEERTPTDAEQRDVLLGPARLVAVQAVLWIVGAMLFTVLNGLRDPLYIAPVAITVLLGGATTCATTYLLSERILRPVASAALADRPPRRPVVPGVTARAMLTWTLGTAIPVVGLVVVAIFVLGGDETTVERLAVTAVVLGGTTLLVGAFTTLLAARATASAVAEVRAALTQVEQGDLGARAAVFDGTELGLLQAGFNRMAEGLGERERIRDLFGRHVGIEVAGAAIDGRVELGGEERSVAVLFVDVTGSTTLAATRAPAEVVEVLNRFFGVVVDVVHEHRGLINKFQGDAALAVFGAPLVHDDPAGDALRAARSLVERLRTEVSEIDVGVGVAHGRAVAGNVGAEERYEYTVIGDPVNEAARLSDLAKDHTGRLLASMEAVSEAGSDERDRWRAGDRVTLRGRTVETELAEPVPT